VAVLAHELSYSKRSDSGPNQRLKLTGAAIPVPRGMKVLQAAPAA
jgi:hypothetical protein